MSVGDAVSLVAVAALIVGMAWTLDAELREGYRAARASGMPRIIAIPIAIGFALFSGC